MTRILCLLVTVLVPLACVADTFDFRVVYVDGPASAEIRSGNHERAIQIIELGLSEPNTPYTPGELSTLCALYVVQKHFDDATTTCDDAVDIDRSYAAFNNRGVLKVHVRDIDGARADFDRARIHDEHRENYIATLLKGDARIIASDNFEIVDLYAKQVARIEAGKLAGVRIETLDPDAPR